MLCKIQTKNIPFNLLFSAQTKNMEFDFEDEPSSAVKFGTTSRTPKTMSANKKKTVTTFGSVLEKIKKHGAPK